MRFWNYFKVTSTNFLKLLWGSFLKWTKGCFYEPWFLLSLPASMFLYPLYVWCLFNQALPADVCLLISVWQGGLLWFTHSTVAQLLCSQDNSSTFLSWNPSVKGNQENNKSLTEIKEKNILFFLSHLLAFNWSVRLLWKSRLICVFSISEQVLLTIQLFKSNSCFLIFYLTLMIFSTDICSILANPV